MMYWCRSIKCDCRGNKQGVRVVVRVVVRSWRGVCMCNGVPVVLNSASVFRCGEGCGEVLKVVGRCNGIPVVLNITAVLRCGECGDEEGGVQV